MKTVKLTALIGKNVEGLRAQVTNPRFLKLGAEERMRTLRAVRTYTENGHKWVSLQWVTVGGNDCGFTGCTIQSNVCAIQFEQSEYAKI